MNKKKVIFLSALVVLILDQITKAIVIRKLELGIPFKVLDDILYFTFITNTGSAFGLLKNMNLVFIIFSLIVIGLIMFWTVTWD